MKPTLRTIAKATALEGVEKGINRKTIRREADRLSTIIFGVSMKDVNRDPALRAYLRYLLYGEDPWPWVQVDPAATKQ